MDLNTIHRAIAKLDAKFDKLDSKLDSHAERLVVVEEKSKSMAGTIKLALSGLIAVISSVVIYTFQLVFGHK
jgi:hypothetical protein